MRALGAALLLLAPAGCRCRDGDLDGVEPGFRVNAASLDFGRAQEGAEVSRSLLLSSTSRVEAQISVTTRGPFSAPSELRLPGATELPLEVVFTAGSERVEGALELAANGKTVSVALSGEGVRPRECRPSAPCRESQFDLQLDTCVASVSLDGASCQPPSDCLEKGVCRGGSCLGSPRSCEDQNRCTSDACAEGLGCLHAPVSCPPPTKPCRVPSCDPATGCGEAMAQDGTPCGPVDCVNANLCLGGECRLLPTPEGFLCAPRTPCQAEGRCRAQQCQRPDAGEMAPSYAVPLPLPPAPGGSEEPTLLTHQGNLFFELCGPRGSDSGCQLRSYTGSGFERFTFHHPDLLPRRVAAASDAGVLVLTPLSLEAYAGADGAALWSFPFSSLGSPDAGGSLPSATQERIALRASGEVLASIGWRSASADAGPAGDGGLAQTVLRLGSDGALLARETLGLEDGLLAVDELGQAIVYAPSGKVSWLGADGGSLLPAPAGEPSLLASGGRALAGGRYLLEADGGLLAELRWPRDAGERLLPRQLFLARGRVFGFYQACPSGPSCQESDLATRLLAFDLNDGRALWEATVLPEGARGRVEEAALALVGQSAVVTLTEAELDGGREAHLQLFAEGKRLFLCPLPPGGELGGAAFAGGFVHLLVNRGGSWRLEAYGLAGLSLESTGWPQRYGLSGTRRAR